MLTLTSFNQYLLTAFSNGLWSTDEIIAFVLPLFEEVQSFHENNMVAPFQKAEPVFLSNGKLDIDETFAHPPQLNYVGLESILNFKTIGGYDITGQVVLDHDVIKNSSSVSNIEVQENPNDDITRPVYLPGYSCYEIKLKHHDALTDVFFLGLILGSVVMGLDLNDIDDLNTFAAYRNKPAGINPRIHPTVAGLVSEMTELDRKKRSSDLMEVIQRLKFYRDYDPQRQTDLSGISELEEKKPADRNAFILSKLKNRLFDTSRRNRMLYYKPNSRFANLTVSSVPSVLHYQSINPHHLFTWNEEISKLIIKGNDLNLNKYLRFEDHPYLSSQLNTIRQQSENDKKEYGFSQLKLVLAFLHWHNLKENTNERIQSPLLLLAVNLERKKSLKEERFTIKPVDNTAVINPVLSNFLKDLYGIILPERISLDEVSMHQFYQMLQLQLDEAKQGVKINYIDKPRIKIIHSVARQTINNYKKKLKLKSSTGIHRLDYSYSEDNYKPLGLEIFRQKIKQQQSSLEFLLDNDADHQPQSFSLTSDQPVKSTFEITDGESNPYSWDFDVCNFVLGNFNYKKMSLVSDYNAITENKIVHGTFEELFSKSPKNIETTEVTNDPSQWYHVIIADPTQSKAILFGRTGKSYIIQGPPGTGKSQTITNLIGDFLAQGKTILFVCEKRAALDVVYHRLQQNNLAELCCYIHDSQGDKKPFFKDLKIVYEDFIRNKMVLHDIKQKRAILLNQLLEHIKTLETYHAAQIKVHATSGVTTHHLHDILIELKENIAALKTPSDENVPSYNEWLASGNIIHQLSSALEQTGADPQLANHPFSNISTAAIQSDKPIAFITELIRKIQSAIHALNDVIKQNNIPREHTSKLEQIKNLIQDSVLLEALAESRNLQLVNAANPEAKEFEASYSAYLQLKNHLKEAEAKITNWTNSIHKDEIDEVILLAEKHETSFFSFLNSKWRKLKKVLNNSYQFNNHSVRPAYSFVLKQLREAYQSEKRVNDSRKALEEKYKVADIETVQLGIDVLRRKQGDKEIDFLLQHPASNELVLKLCRLNNLFTDLESELNQCLYSIEEKSLTALQDELSTLGSNTDSLKTVLPSLRAFSLLPASFQHFFRTTSVTPVQAEALIAQKTMQDIYQNDKPFSDLTHVQLEHEINEINLKYALLLKLNSDLIRAERRQQFLKHYEISNTSATVLDLQQKQFKKAYTEGRRILEHEMSKTMRYKSIREIASNDSGKVLRDIKPVWLMSPLSVSDSLPLDTAFFDVVIFDEASQITLEEGLPALFRAPQTIIVGDDKQMPPSNFFNTKTEDPQDLEIYEGEAEDEILSTDADSILVQASRKFKSTMLSWHYRSRYETLISYSNHAFYNAGLLTVPDNTIHHLEKKLLEVKETEEGIKNASLLLKESITYHYLSNGLYEARGNVNEAKYIACMVKKLLMDDTKETIGIVAFSQEQQSVIEDAIEELSASDKLFEEILEKAYNRTDEGQFTGLFIKNLENVQGDERDIIIMSICYGYDVNKKMLMNFGPINRKGGERRLNVIFSRAKKHMAVISSIRYPDIKNEYNDGANYLRRFLQYAEMVSTGNMAMARTILDGLVTKEHAAPSMHIKPSAVTTQLKKSLEQKGYFADENIGQSSFTCTLGIKRKAEDTRYCLGILIDDDKHYKNHDLVEQYYQRPAILEAFGWKIMKVYAKDWYADERFELEKIIRLLDGTINTNNTNPAPTETRNILENHLHFSTYHSADHVRFWQIAQDKNQLQIRFGKTGTLGQVQIKSYELEGDAAIAMKELIKVQVEGGFVLGE